MTARVAIIGAGLAGLTAANHLVDEGVDVAVFERAKEPGGRASTTTHGDYRFNQGPHALYLGGEAHSTLTALGIDPIGHAPIQGKAGALIDDEVRRLPIGPRSLAATDLIGAREKIRFASFLARIQRFDPEDHVGSTVEEWAASVSTDRAMIELLLAFMRLGTYANAPDLACAGAFLRQLQRAVGDGVIYLDGGWGQLVARLSERATAAGATITRQQVGSLDEILDRFDAVVLAVGGPALTDQLLGTTTLGTSTLGTTTLAARTGPPIEAAVLELGVRTVPANRFILGIDEPLYASVHCPPAELAPPGHSVICLARYLTPGERHDAGETSERLTRLAYRLGITQSDIAESRYLHRMTVAHGMPLAAAGGLAGRPGVDSAGDARIAIAGDWVGPQGLLADASVASGRTAAKYLLRAAVAA